MERHPLSTPQTTPKCLKIPPTQLADMSRAQEKLPEQLCETCHPWLHFDPPLSTPLFLLLRHKYTITKYYCLVITIITTRTTKMEERRNQIFTWVGAWAERSVFHKVWTASIKSARTSWRLETQSWKPDHPPNELRPSPEIWKPSSKILRRS